jgi:hypothetical protein
MNRERGNRLKAQIAREILRTHYAQEEHEKKGGREVPWLNHDDLSRKAADNILTLSQKLRRREELTKAWARGQARMPDIPPQPKSYSFRKTRRKLVYCRRCEVSHPIGAGCPFKPTSS